MVGRGLGWSDDSLPWEEAKVLAGCGIVHHLSNPTSMIFAMKFCICSYDKAGSVMVVS